MQPFDPLTLNLQGQVLIEASAGTGKTYSIALLFLRLLLEAELGINEILVVTFTKAATAELRERVRERIREALDELESPGSQDPLLQELIRSINNRAEASNRLMDALTCMDEAAIYTIHGFCQRMLQEHAFNSGAPFEMEFLETQGPLRRRIIEDFWRIHFYHCVQQEAEWLTGQWNEPQNLLDDLSGHLSRPEVKCIPEVGQDQIKQQIASLEPVFAQIKSVWQRNEHDIIELLEEAIHNKHLSVSKDKGYSPDRLFIALEAMRALSVANMMPLRLAHENELALLTCGKLELSLNKKARGIPPRHEFFDIFDEFFSAHDEMSKLKRVAVLLEARAYLLSELARRKKQRGQLYFDDLLTQLEVALGSEGGKKLARHIGTRFPAILVDEFQDTDPKQYSIFSTIHQSSESTDATSKTPCLILVGDPKQAIYGFRGADVFTYIQAAKDTHGKQRFTMNTNYRSTSPMVEAVNQIFSREQAFIFDAIRYSPVSANGKNKPNLVLQNGKPIPPLNCVLLKEVKEGKPISKEQAATQAARCCAREIVGLLAGRHSNRSTLDGAQLQPKDIAVLVRTHDEAEHIRKALKQSKISSVYSGRESVFASAEAQQLSLLLVSLLDLSGEARVRTALSTDLFGLGAEKLDELRNDDRAWATQIETLRNYRKAWQQTGFSHMFHLLLSNERLVQRLRHATDGERSLTNFTHLSELLQSAALQQQGAEGLLRWFNEQIQSPEPDAEQQQLRLESDENLIKIVTIHKAKGLEYPIVFLPFLWASRICKEDEPLAYHPVDHPGEYRVYLGVDSSERAAIYNVAEKERLAEDLRLLYVAFTRAKYGCYFCWGHISKMEESALFYLLQDQNAAPEEMQELITNDLAITGRDGPGAHITTCSDASGLFDQASLQTPTTLQARKFNASIDTRQPIVSHSSLSHRQYTRIEGPDYDHIQLSSAQNATGSRSDVFGFPKGAKAGICLHSILEDISFTDPVEHGPIIIEHLFRAGINQSWVGVVENWMTNVLDTELSTGFFLRQLDRKDRLNEMSFYYSLNPLDWLNFNRTLEKFAFDRLDKQGKLQGLMRGFVDLVYRHEGKYYIADYKSNHLGNTPADYQQESLHAAMLAHRYDLQYLIYTQALHRFLASRIQNYDYDKHFGGVYYLFLRGMNPENPPGYGVYYARPSLDCINALDRHCASEGTT